MVIPERSAGGYVRLTVLRPHDLIPEAWALLISGLHRAGYGAGQREPSLLFSGPTHPCPRPGGGTHSATLPDDGPTARWGASGPDQDGPEKYGPEKCYGELGW